MNNRQTSSRQMSEPLMKLARAIAAVVLTTACGGCWTGAYEDPGAEYLHRSDTITLSAGNAKNVNAATHTIDPWPRQVTNRRIPGHGERMAHTMERYRSGQTGPASQTGTQVIGIPVGAATPSQSGGSNGTPAQ
jgi:hypothetical protein